MGLREDAIEAADNDRSAAAVEVDEATIDLRDTFAQWCAAMGIERVPPISVTKESYEASEGVASEMHFTTVVDDIPLRGYFVRGEKLRMMYGDNDREINSLADLGRAVKAEERGRDIEGNETRGGRML